MGEVLLKALYQAFGDLLVAAGKVEQGVQVLAQIVVEPGDDNAAQIFLYLPGRVDSLGAYEGVYKEHRLDDTDVEDPEGAQTYEAQLVVPEGYRVARAPFEVGECLQGRKVNLCPERALEGPREAERLCQDRKVLRFESMPAWPYASYALPL